MLLAGSFICFWEVASSSHGTLHLRIFWCPLIFPGSQENLFWLISFHWTIQNISLQMHLILEWNSDFFRPVLHTLIRGEWLWTPSVFYLSLGWVLSDYVQSFLCLRGKKGRNKNKIFKECNDITSVNKCQILIFCFYFFNFFVIITKKFLNFK